jgi:hypothetical protein
MKVCKWKGMHETWFFGGTNWEVIQNWPIMMKLWQWILIILANTTICECGFSKQYGMKNDCKSQLKLETLDALIRKSLCGLPMENMNWANFFDTCMEIDQHRRALP